MPYRAAAAAAGGGRRRAAAGGGGITASEGHRNLKASCRDRGRAGKKSFIIAPAGSRPAQTGTASADMSVAAGASAPPDAAAAAASGPSASAGQLAAASSSSAASGYLRVGVAARARCRLYLGIADGMPRCAGMGVAVLKPTASPRAF